MAIDVASLSAINLCSLSYRDLESTKIVGTSVFDALFLGCVIALTNVSVLRCWDAVRKSYGFSPNDRIPLYSYLIPEWAAPSWTFFAPNPGRYDYRLLVRQRIDDLVTPWFEPVSFRPRNGGICEVFWNPTRFKQKLLIDLVTSLQVDLNVLHNTERESANFDVIQLTSGYLACLKMAIIAATGEAASEVQFSIARSTALANEPEMIFCSNWHSVSN